MTPSVESNFPCPHLRYTENDMFTFSSLFGPQKKNSRIFQNPFGGGPPAPYRSAEPAASARLAPAHHHAAVAVELRLGEAVQHHPLASGSRDRHSRRELGLLSILGILGSTFKPGYY